MSEAIRKALADKDSRKKIQKFLIKRQSLHDRQPDLVVEGPHGERIIFELKEVGAAARK